MAQLNDALVRQKQRMEIAMIEEQEARKSRRNAKSGRGIEKHMIEAESSADGAKRARLEGHSGSGQGSGAEVDVTSISVDIVIDLVMAGLSAVSLDHLRWAFDVSGIWHIKLMPECSTGAARSFGRRCAVARDIVGCG